MEKKCINCGKPLTNRQQKYCCVDCQVEYRYKCDVEKWKNGELKGCDKNGEISNFVRRYMFEKVGYKCEVCGFNTPNQYTGLTILQIHHIDGNCMNNNEENLQVLCPNHHALTDNFGRLNTNSGRKTRYKK